MSLRTRSPRAVVVARAFVAVAAAGLVPAGCGGSSPSSHTLAQRPPVSSVTTPHVSARAGTPARTGGHKTTARPRASARAGSTTTSASGHETTAAAARRAGTPKGKHEGRGQPNTHQPTHVKVTGPPPLNPCTLVTGAQAQAIVGASLRASKEAPLGPTCVFEFTGRQATITLAVESLSFPKTIRQMRKATRLAVAGMPADCGTLGTQMLFVSLSGGRVLNVTAPCPIARAFAVQAVSRLHA